MQRNVVMEVSVMEALILSQLYKATGFMGVRHQACMKITLDTYLHVSILKNRLWDVPPVVCKQTSDKVKCESSKYYNYISLVLIVCSC